MTTYLLEICTVASQPANVTLFSHYCFRIFIHTITVYSIPFDVLLSLTTAKQMQIPPLWGTNSLKVFLILSPHINKQVTSVAAPFHFLFTFDRAG